MTGPDDVVRLGPAARLHGALEVPGDKSVSHRALILGALAHGSTTIRRLAPGADVRSTRRCLEALGVSFEERTVGKDALTVVAGRGPGALAAPSGPLDCGNSGTTMRLLAGALAGAGIAATLTGDDSLSRRPMGRVARPLRSMGCDVEATTSEAGPDRPPLRIHPSGRPRAIAFESPIASAQVKSAVLLAGLSAEGEVSVREPARSRDHTERMLRLFGVDITEEGLRAMYRGPVDLEGATVFVPGDPSSAAFFLAAAAALPGSKLVLRDVSSNPTRTGFLDALGRMGCEVIRAGEESWGFEPVCDLVLHAPGGLSAVTIEGDEVPRLIDELPVLAVIATRADGVTEIRDAAELRVKESDRLRTTAELIRALGGDVQEREDGLRIPGRQTLKGGAFDAAGDHRLAMAAAVGALISTGPTEVSGASAAAVSYPRFFEDLASLIVA